MHFLYSQRNTKKKMILLEVTLLKLIRFQQGRGPKPRYRIHLLPHGIMLCFAVVDGRDHGEEVYRYDFEWLSELDYAKAEEEDDEV